MSFRMGILGAIGLGFVTLASCGNSESSSQSAPSGPGEVPISSAPIAIENLCPVFINDLCTYLMQCNHARYRDIQHCQAETDCYGLPELTESAQRGSVIYDPSKVGECHARFLKDPCHFGLFFSVPDIFEVLGKCPNTITPKRDEGQSCVSNGECTGDLYCRKDERTCPGTCVRYRNAGESCSDGTECKSDLWCDAGTCTGNSVAGDPCTEESDCGLACIGNGCEEPLWCDITSRTCKPAAQEGQPCGVIKSEASIIRPECAKGLWCDDAFPGQPGFCRKPGGAGSPCTSDGSCEKNLHCGGYKPFRDQATMGKCVALGGVGAACTLQSECEESLRCLGGACKTEAQLTEACRTSQDCAKGLTCEEERCVAARYPGDACGDPDSACVLSNCKGGTCTLRSKVGVSCTNDADCTMRTCFNGKCADPSVCAPR